MKKFLMALVIVGAIFTLTACANIPEGVDEQFHTKAMGIFIDSDEDTMEIYDPEGTDTQDFANFQVLASTADSEREVQFVKGMEAMLKLQPAVRDNAKRGEALPEYLKARQVAMNAMNFGDNGEGDRFQVPTFQFIEEE